MRGFHAIDFLHQFAQGVITPGACCVDATAGRGQDTLFLAQLVGAQGKVLAFDIQAEAIHSTKQRLQQQDLLQRVELYLENHIFLEQYIALDSVDSIWFNFGYLPGGNHQIATRPAESVLAIQKALPLLKPQGWLFLCVYQGGDTGFAEKEAILSAVQSLDRRQYTVIYNEFINKPNFPPIPILIRKESSML